MIYLGDFLSKVPKTELNRYLKELNIDKEDVENLKMSIVSTLDYVNLIQPNLM